MSASELIRIIALFGAGICIGAGAIGPSAGIGFIGAKALQGMSENRKQEGALLKTMLIAMAVAETTAVYALVIAVLLMFVV
ncbi:MAG: ATP synthase F0 subunit C [Candidatus Omnitrophica bacterium]|nr:ATP synthase F0 subunit C [Candidatus Omnitrophota bacterium]